MDKEETPDLMMRMIGWILRRIGSQRLAGGSLLAALLITASIGLEEVGRGLDGTQLALTACTAALMGWLAARTLGRRPRLALAGLALFGAAWILLVPGGLLEPVFQFCIAGLEWLAAAIRQPKAAPLPDPAAARVLWTDLSLQWNELYGRVSAWTVGVFAGKSAYDQAAAQTIWSALLFASGGWAGWALRRGTHPLWSVLPAAGLLAAGLSFVGAGTIYLFPVLACTIALLAWDGYHRASIDWERRRVDIADGLALDLGMWGLGIVLGVAALALPLSKPAPQKLVQAVQELTGSRAQAVQSVGESLGLEARPQGSTAVSAGGLMPRQRLLGAGPEITERLVFEVEWPRQYSAQPAANALPSQVERSAVDIPQALARPYWRGATYDVYTGRGWATSAIESRDYRAGEALPATLSGRRKLVEAAFRFSSAPLEALPTDEARSSDSESRATGQQVYAPGEPVTLDQSFHLASRPVPVTDPGAALSNLDLHSLALLRPGDHYRVRTEIRLTSAAELQSALAPPPDWIARRYLVLTPDLPPRLIALAGRLAVGRSTPYEKALAIESYLRQLPYSLDVPEPPPGRDVVDYFLFDLRTGYCDYYASAMVLLARLNGLPARLAIGYAPGVYDPSRGSFLVTGGDAHSWPEIYFSGIGWVIFEPTGSRPALERPQQAEAPSLPAPEAAGKAGSDWSTPLPPWETALGRWLLLFGALAAAGFGAWIGLPAVQALRLRRMEPGVAIESIYNTMRQAALPRRQPYREGCPTAKAALPPSHRFPGFKKREAAQSRELSAETPYEFARELESQIAGTTVYSRLKPWMAPAPELAWRIAKRYARAAYSPAPPARADVDLTLSEWRQLKPRLWWLRVLRSVQPPHGRG